MLTVQVRETLLVASLIGFVLTSFPVDFSVFPQKLRDLDGNITRILNTSTPTKSNAEDLMMSLQSYVFNLGPLTNIMALDKGVQDVAKTVLLQGRPAFLYIPVKEDIIQQAFRWNDNQIKVLHFLYDNADKHWNRFVEKFGTLNNTTS